MAMDKLHRITDLKRILQEKYLVATNPPTRRPFEIPTSDIEQP
jgi:hypothetical protein